MQPTHSNPIADLLIALVDAEVRFVVCGGVAAVLYGVERMTMDIDMLINLDEMNFAIFIDLMSKLGLKPRAPVNPADLMDPGTRKRWIHEKNALVFTFIDPDYPVRQIDIFLEPPLPFPDVLARATFMRIGGRSIPVASIDDLIPMKRMVQPPRKKDSDDIEALQKLRESAG